ncbi:MAG: hypothetical protein EPO13_05595 [Actinomycetota bacterium]|nr:MAG: hypothetical protein EPO13_05595 [Actinomycetota bacterium]
MRLGTRIAAAALTSGVLVTTAACGATARGSDGYTREAGAYAAAGGSAAASGALSARLWLRDLAFTRYTDVAVTSSEDDLATVHDSFAAIQPPTEADVATYDALDALLADAGDALTGLRIALRQGRSEEVAAAAEQLAGSAEELQDFAEDRS